MYSGKFSFSICDNETLVRANPTNLTKIGITGTLENNDTKIMFATSDFYFEVGLKDGTTHDMKTLYDKMSLLNHGQLIQIKLKN